MGVDVEVTLVKTDEDGVLRDEVDDPDVVGGV